MEKMIFLNVGWMKNYKGLKNDSLKHGGKNPEKLGYGGEIFNFLPYKGYMFGYVQPPKDLINFERLGASEQDDLITKVLAIWTAKSPNRGTVIVGWFKNATVYREWQPPPKNSKRTYKREQMGYYIKAKEKNCNLLY